MTKRMLIDALYPEEMRVVIADERQIHDFDLTTASKKQVKGNIYLAKITRVEPSLQAAFVEYGGGKQGFLPFAEIHADYYQLPMSDRKRLMEEAEQDEEPHAAAEPEAAPGEEASAGEAHEPLPAAEAFPELPLGDALPELPEHEEAHPPAQAERVSFAESEIVAGQQAEHAELAQSLNGEQDTETNGSGETEGGASGGGDEGVETLANEEEEIKQRRQRSFFRRYKIQEVIKRGQVVLVQVIKEERGNKGVSLTTYLSLPGRYCVLMPNSPKDGGVSRKISDGDTRKRLKEMMAELKLARGMSVIIRTAGMDRTRAEIRRDFDYLVKLWNQIRETTLASTAPALVYEEGDLIKRAIRDQYTSDIEEVMVEGEEAYKSARDFMKMLLPSHTPRVKQYKDGIPIFYAYGVEDQLLSMHDPVVKLKSGGYIVINPTEALISIDVNSGRATGERNIEETATRTNLEAANEVARQLRLRDLAGLIVIDFIDMYESRNRRAIERTLKDALKSDRAKIQLGRISPFGLLEMSRQRLRPSISETNNITCPHCTGRGSIRSNESMSIQMVRALEKEAASGNWGMLKLNAPENIALHLLNTKRALLDAIEQRYGVVITIAIDHGLTAVAFTVEKNRKGGGRERAEQPREPREEGRESRRSRGGRGRDRERPERQERIEQPADEPVEVIEEEVEENADPAGAELGSDGKPRRSRRGRRGGRNRRRGREPENGGRMTDDGQEAQETEATEPVESEAPPEPRESRPRRSRGERAPAGGRKRWRGDEGSEKVEGREIKHHEAETFPPAPLPDFTRSEAVEAKAPELVVSHTRHAAPVSPASLPETSARPDGAPPRKGWWQRIIELE